MLARHRHGDIQWRSLGEWEKLQVVTKVIMCVCRRTKADSMDVLKADLKSAALTQTRQLMVWVLFRLYVSFEVIADLLGTTPSGAKTRCRSAERIFPLASLQALEVEVREILLKQRII